MCTVAGRAGTTGLSTANKALQHEASVSGSNRKCLICLLCVTERGEANVTLGIPRLQRAHSIKTLPIKKVLGKADAPELANRLCGNRLG